MAVLAHISDLHFGRENERILNDLLEYLSFLHPELIVISGDLTQRARTREYKAAENFLSQLSQPYHVIPGNHDISASNLVERFTYPWRKWYRHISHDLEPVISGDEYLVVGVNTSRRLGALINWSRGRINMLQSRHVKQCFGKDKRERLRVVSAHHPFWLPGAYEHRHLIGGRDAALQDFVEAGVDLILSGHVHFAYTHVLSGIIVSHAGTTVSNRLVSGSPNSFKVIRGDLRSICIETRTWDGHRFRETEEECFVKEEGGWVRYAASVMEDIT